MGDNAAKRPPQSADPIVSQIGEFGCYQLWFCFLVFLCKLATGWHTLAHLFLAAPTDISCKEPENITDACDSSCEEYEFDKSVFESTIVMEWSLICEYSKLATMSQSLVMLGIMLGSIAFGICSDKLGRRPAFLMACFLQLITGLLVALAPAFWMYCTLRFLVAFATGGSMTIGFVLILELIGSSKMEVVAIVCQIPFHVGHSTLAVFSHLTREWRRFQFSISVFSIVFLIYICLIPESPRWLFSTGNLEHAIEILENIAKKNKLATEPIRAEIHAAYNGLKEPGRKATLLDLFRTSYLCKKMVFMAFDWFVVCMVYYGVGQYISKLEGNIFLNVGLAAALGVPGTLLSIVSTKLVGRKCTCIFSSLVSAVSMLSFAVFPNMPTQWQIVCATCGLFAASLTFANVNLYVGELFPTVVRSSGVGFCSMIGRIGSVCAPFVTDLTERINWLAPLIFGIFSLLAAVGTSLLPETHGRPLPETLQDGKLQKEQNKRDTAKN